MSSVNAPSAELPMIFFVPGAWHGPWVFDQTRHILSERGFDTATSDLRTVESNDASIGVQDDANHVRSALTKLIDMGKEIIVVAHSYGGIIAANSIDPSLGIKQRAADSCKGGVILVLLLAAFAIPKNTSLLDNIGGKLLPWWDAKEEGFLTVKNPFDVFYHDVQPYLAAEAVAALKRMPYRFITDVSTCESWNDGIDFGYIFAEEDQAIPFGAQGVMFSRLPQDSFSVTLKTSHSPFLSKPDAVVDAIESAVQFLSRKK
ncbi:Alpha/beta hydrolase fold-1 [Xylariaceae sp. FL0255]|nr:Alpha/beta hydrolase fold-1 [Xylariaceae sp. FL0255]